MSFADFVCWLKKKKRITHKLEIHRRLNKNTYLVSALMLHFKHCIHLLSTLLDKYELLIHLEDYKLLIIHQTLHIFIHVLLNQ